jgi:hypothetical protein
VTRLARVALLLSLAIACRVESGVPAPSAEPSPASPSPTPRYEPGQISISGIIARIDAGRVVIRNPEGEFEVDVTGLRSFWKETEVGPSDLEVGDQLDLNGVRSGQIFEARYVWANIGRFDGIVRARLGVRLELDRLPPSTGNFEVELSRYLKIVRGSAIPAAVADIQPGMNVGGVLYRPRTGLPRVTKLWLP